MRIGRTVRYAIVTAVALCTFPEVSSANTNCGNPGANEAIIWEHSNFTGNCDILGIGSYSTSDLTSTSVGVDNISAVSVGSNVKITLYDSDLPGVGTPGNWLPSTWTRSVYPAFNDITESLRVESQTSCGSPGAGQAIVYLDYSFGGRCDVMDVNYPATTIDQMLGLSVGNDQVSSILCSSGVGVELWVNTSYGGSYYNAGGNCNVSSLTTFNDQASTIKVGWVS